MAFALVYCQAGGDGAGSRRWMTSLRVTLCAVLCCVQVCGGTVLRCLTQKKDEIKSEACRKEVFYFEKMEVSNYHNDVILAAQCRADVDKFCKDVPPGELFFALSAIHLEL
jgi:hypothetical protein